MQGIGIIYFAFGVNQICRLTPKYTCEGTLKHLQTDL